MSVLVRMTGVNQRFVFSDVETIAHVVEDFSKKADYDWQCWAAHNEVPWWKEEEVPHQSQELFQINRRICTMSDAAIIHAHDNGSTALGYLYKMLVEAPHRPPVLVVAHEKTVLSKAWEGQKNHHLSVSFERFGGDEMGSLELRNVVWDWLGKHQAAIDDGPMRRKEIESHFVEKSERLVAAWRRATRAQRREIAAHLMLPEHRVRDLIADPMELASLPMYHFGVTMSLVDSLAEFLPNDVRAAFSTEELAAWRLWASRKPDELARAVVAAAARERRKKVVASELGDMTQEGGWESFRRRWEQRRAG